MYKKIRRNDNNSLLRNNKNYLIIDRDSGIATTDIESDMEQPRPNYIFSDDDDEVNQVLMNNLGDIHNIPLQETAVLFNSPTYYTSLADQAVTSIRHHLKDSNWKKVLKHKSGTTVHMLQNTVEKTALFRGEAIIQGFTPQSIFYVIGMRKLWDEQFEEGNLIENLNDTTSLTYESYKSTATSKGYDLTLVEKIECSADGEILFTCTSVDTPKVPKTPGKNRNQIKLQGWILKQLRTSPVSTQVTYITQENIKGWIPGLTKKSLARKPLIIASIDNYLKKKSDRLRLQQPQPRPQPQQQSVSLSSTLSLPINDTSETLLKSSRQQSSISIFSNNHSNSSYSIPIVAPQTSPTLDPSSSLEQHNKKKKLNTIILSNPPPRISSLNSGSSNTVKHISFADDIIQNNNSRSSSPMDTSAYTSSSSSSSARSSYETEEKQRYDNINDLSGSEVGSPPPLVPSHTYHSSSSQPLSPIHEAPSTPLSPFALPKSAATKKDFSSKAIAGSKLYPASRHRNARKQCMDQLKSYINSDINEWKPIGDNNNNSRTTTKLYSKSFEGSTLPILRSDSTFYGSWTPEQICSVIQCFGARKIWDEHFEDGHVVERFSQKEYLIYTQMKSIFPIQSRDFSILTCIESNVSSGVIYVASTSVQDELILDVPEHIRGSFMTYGWALEPLRSPRQHRLIGVKATFIAHLDMGGATPLPSSISRMLTTEVPSCVDRIQHYLRQNGCPPYIRRVAGKIVFESFNHHQNKQYHIQFIAKHAPSARQYRSRNSDAIQQQAMWCTDLRTHPSMYPLGYTIETQPEYGIRVEMRPDAMGFRIYTEVDDMDGKTISAVIKQNLAGNKPFYSWNGIPLFNEEKEVCAEENINSVAATAIRVEQKNKLEPTAAVVTNFEEKDHQHVISTNSNNDKAVHYNHMYNELEPNNKNEYQRRNSNHNIIVFSEDLAFTAHQFSFLILLMAICYYLGKFSCRCSI